jgi:Domain of unknown function (DUF5666)
MHSTTRAFKLAACAFAVVTIATTANSARFIARAKALPQPQQATGQTTAKQLVGAIQAIKGNTITLKPDAGPAVDVLLQGSVRILRVAPGQTDLKNATTIQLADLQVGDRVLVRATPSADGQSLAVSTVIAMKRSDVEAKQQQEREDWQKRGIGGLVGAVDPSSGTINVSVAGPGGVKAIAIHTAKDTIIRRYAPDSVQFDDAKSSSLTEIKAGDQLRARGARSADGAEFAAEEIVAGAFRNISGTIVNLDAASNMLTVMDLASKKPVLVKISSQSQVLKLPPPLAQGIAFQMKGAPRGAGEGENARPARTPADLQQVLGRLPKSSLADLQKGDAVMIVSTEGTASGGVTAITLLGGVEPILQASPSAAQAMTLSPWNIGAGGGDQAGEANP